MFSCNTYHHSIGDGVASFRLLCPFTVRKPIDDFHQNGTIDAVSVDYLIIIKKGKTILAFSVNTGLRRNIPNKIRHYFLFSNDMP